MDKLILKYLESSLTKHEETILYDWIKNNAENLEYFKTVVRQYGINDPDFMVFDSEMSFKKLKSRIETKQSSEKLFRLRPYLKYAAVILLF